MSETTKDFSLPYPDIKKIPDTEPAATPELWNETYEQIDENFDALKTKLVSLMNDLITPSVDLGLITEEVEDFGLPGGTSSTLQPSDGAAVSLVAQHLNDCIHPVGANIQAVKTVAENMDELEDVSSMTKTDYAKIFNEGV